MKIESIGLPRLVILFALPVFGCTVAKSSAMPEQLLDNNLEAFVVENELSAYELSKMLSSRTWNSAKIGKGGVGIVEGSIYVVLNSDQNSVRIDGEVWTGGHSGTLDVVAISKGSVIASGDRANDPVEILIIFLPQEIYFLNLVSGESGKYRRRPESSPEMPSPS